MKKYAKLMEKITSWSQVHVSVSKPHRMCIEFTMPAKTVDPNVYTLWLNEGGGRREKGGGGGGGRGRVRNRRKVEAGARKTREITRSHVREGRNTCTHEYIK